MEGNYCYRGRSLSRIWIQCHLVLICCFLDMSLERQTWSSLRNRQDSLSRHAAWHSRPNLGYIRRLEYVAKVFPLESANSNQNLSNRLRTGLYSQLECFRAWYHCEPIPINVDLWFVPTKEWDQFLIIYQLDADKENSRLWKYLFWWCLFKMSQIRS